MFGLHFSGLLLFFLFVCSQTGSGKTYTMGTNYSGEESAGGIIPKVMETIFKRVQAMKESSEFLIRVSFIEVKKNTVLCLVNFICHWDQAFNTCSA